MSMNRIDPKRFEDADFVLQYFGAVGFDVNEMNRLTIEDRVQINLLTVVATLGKALQAEQSKPLDSAKSDTKTEVEGLNKQREENKKAAENAPENSTIQTTESVTTNPSNLGQTSSESESESGNKSSSSNPESGNETKSVDMSL